MYLIFDAQEENLYDIFKTLSYDDIKNSLELKIYNRGLEYFKSDCKSDVEFNQDKTKLTATVYGTDDYNITLSFNKGKVQGSCTCPYGGVCKHQAAVLLYAINKLAEIDIPTQEKNKESIHSHLQSLSKSELIALVEKYAPKEFFTTISNQFVDTDSAQQIIQKVERKIQQILKNENLLYDIGDFSNAIDKEIKKLSGLELSLKEEIESLIFYMMQEIDNAFDEGYLYDDYSDYCYYPSSDFDKFVVRYAASIEGQAKISFLAKLDSIICEQNYDTFSDWRKIVESAFDKKDLPELKKSLIQTHKDISRELAEEYYDHVSDLMSFDEKEIVLTTLVENNSKRLIELAELYNINNQLDQAIGILKTWLQGKSSHWGDEPVYSLYLDLLQKGEHELLGAAREAISGCPTDSMLKKIVTMIPSHSTEYEKLLEKNNAGDFLKYLESEKRLPEAFELIKRKPTISDYQQYDFFKKHKTIFPKDAAIYFSNVIDKNLNGTGDSYYEAIAEAIRHLMKINSKQADKYLLDIRTNYKRRRNLIALLEKI